jgi:hypothetical protein
MFTHSIGTSYKTDAGTVINIAENIVGTNQGVDIDTVIGPGATTAYNVLITPDLCQSVMLCSDQPTTIKTNDPNNPQHTIPLKANVPIVWTLNSFWPIPFGPEPVNAMYITNTGGSAANVKIRVLSN